MPAATSGIVAAQGASRCARDAASPLVWPFADVNVLAAGGGSAVDVREAVAGFARCRPWAADLSRVPRSGALARGLLPP